MRGFTRLGAVRLALVVGLVCVVFAAAGGSASAFSAGSCVGSGLAVACDQVPISAMVGLNSCDGNSDNATGSGACAGDTQLSTVGDGSCRGGGFDAGACGLDSGLVVVSAGSCVGDGGSSSGGLGACAHDLNLFSVDANSCNGTGTVFAACAFAGSLHSVNGNSCNSTGSTGFGACAADSELISVGANSCDGGGRATSACASNSTLNSVRGNSCNGADDSNGLGACSASGLTAVGDNSCNGPGACNGVTGAVGDCQDNTVPVSACTPDLTITKTHVGDFTEGQQGSYAITVTNSGSAPTSGTITVTDTLPPGLIIVAIITGSNWDCSHSTGLVLTCTSSSALAAGAGTTITLNVQVASDAQSVTNTASVSGGGETNTTNDTASDPTTVDATSCAAGSWSPTGLSPCTLADPGFFVSGAGATSETVCDGGTYAHAGSVSCNTDPAGTFSGWARDPQHPARGYLFRARQPCLIPTRPGTSPGRARGSQHSVTPVPTRAGSASCSTDPAGTFSGPGAESPTLCGAGTYSAAGSASCSTDPAGTFSGPGAGSPTPATGYYSEQAAVLRDRPGRHVLGRARDCRTPVTLGTYSPATAPRAYRPSRHVLRAGRGSAKQLSCRYLLHRGQRLVQPRSGRHVLRAGRGSAKQLSRRYLLPRGQRLVQPRSGWHVLRAGCRIADGLCGWHLPTAHGTGLVPPSRDRLLCPIHRPEQRNGLPGRTDNDGDWGHVMCHDDLCPDRTGDGGCPGYKPF